MKTKFRFTMFLFLASVAFAGEKVAQPKVDAQVKPTLIFFMNPNGAPCQMQDQIIAQGKNEIEKSAQIRYVKTTVPADRETFYQFGIRTLPNLVIVDAQGKELRRFAPGIQPIEAIVSALTGK